MRGKLVFINIFNKTTYRHLVKKSPYPTGTLKNIPNY